ncbi:MAG: HopJ type III effector protein [Methylicorpusculum sp.]|uniref:HopJ type III effector protein n=1 Tax=Methylicorpusculum sp. TaxID=2713644 RepID=UPI0027249168|nr:HopJ type III effector protein [Methylicorpusculum sp.]MDO8939533.1 HopJ type III effector protein [Methylicorpusculum sp.]MDP2204563.1 HopJ type III effector protein [Methylicorpusculum sp.]
MTIKDLIQQIKAQQPVSFTDVIAVIQENYDYTPTEFHNGLDQNKLINEAGKNEGSCKIFAFARLNELTQDETLGLFGDYYRKDVLNNPEGSDHQNIRNFMRYGWEGIYFKSQPLTPRA